MKKFNSENKLKPQSMENDEETTKEVQIEDKKEDNNDESKIFLTPSNTSSLEEDNLISYPKEDGNSDLYNDFDNFCDNKKGGEPYASGDTDIKDKNKLELSKNDEESSNSKNNTPDDVTLKKEEEKEIKITYNLYCQKLENILKIKPKFFFKKKKTYTKAEFIDILKVNNLGEYEEQIKFALENDSDEEEENIWNDDESDINFSFYYSFQNVNLAVDEKEGSTLFKPLLDHINSSGIDTNSSTAGD